MLKSLQFMQLINVNTDSEISDDISDIHILTWYKVPQDLS